MQNAEIFFFIPVCVGKGGMEFNMLGLRKKKKKNTESEEIKKTLDIPVSHDPKHPVSIENLQEIGAREEQQDAFFVSDIQETEKGLLMILCDGMGGMQSGAAISRNVIDKLKDKFFSTDISLIPKLIRETNNDIYSEYNCAGGTTLVMAFILERKLWFWCVGDSDLFLLRNGNLYSMNRRHEYQNELMELAICNEMSVEEVISDKQRTALSDFIGDNKISIDYSGEPFLLENGDKLLLCSDGVSDTLNLEELKQILTNGIGIALKLGIAVSEKQMPNQDNYTAIIVTINDAEQAG